MLIYPSIFYSMHYNSFTRYSNLLTSIQSLTNLISIYSGKNLISFNNSTEFLFQFNFILTQFYLTQFNFNLIRIQLDIIFSLFNLFQSS